MKKKIKIYLKQLWQERKKDASLSSKKWEICGRKRKLAAYIRNMNILFFRIKYRN